jgi:hypothetical protein
VPEAVSIQPLRCGSRNVAEGLSRGLAGAPQLKPGTGKTELSPDLMWLTTEANAYIRKACEASQEPGLPASDSRGHWRPFRARLLGVSRTRVSAIRRDQNRIQTMFVHAAEASGAVPRAGQRLARARAIMRTRQTRDLQEPESPTANARHHNWPDPERSLYRRCSLDSEVALQAEYARLRNLDAASASTTPLPDAPCNSS